jgi:competence/damage-inducible protein CinA-like protein
MNAEIVSIGTELLLGNITDTNATFLTQELAALGINCYWVSQVGDNESRLQEVLRRAWDRSDLTLLTGGLGPTEDDVTRETISALLGEEMVVDPELEAELRAFFAGRNIVMPEQNRKQATRIPSVTILPNPIGTAPGWWVERARDGATGPTRRIAAMPGVPFEMRRMWTQEVAPRLVTLSGAHLASRTLKVLGLGESVVEDRVRDLLHTDNPSVGTYAKNDGIHLRLTARAADEAAARALLAPLEAAMRDRLGDTIWGVDDAALEDVICAALAAAGLRLQVVEVGSITGGQILRVLTSATRHADRLAGGWVVPTGSIAMLAEIAGDALRQPISGDAVVYSPAMAGALAEAVRAGTPDCAALVTVGDLPAARDDVRVAADCHAAVALPGRGARALTIPQRAARGEIKRLAGLAALNLLRRELQAANTQL